MPAIVRVICSTYETLYVEQAPSVLLEEKTLAEREFTGLIFNVVND